MVVVLSSQLPILDTTEMADMIGTTGMTDMIDTTETVTTDGN